MLTALTPYGPTVPSTRVRVRQWLSRTGIPAQLIDYAGLPNHSVGTMVRHAGGVVRAERRQRSLGREHTDRLLIHKEVTPFSNGALARRLVSGANISVYDFDDAVMWTDQLAENQALSPGRLARTFFSKARACQTTVSAVDRVIAGNQVLADWASQHNRDVRLIPSCVEIGDYAVKEQYELGEVPRMVWLGSSATEPQLQVIAEALPQVAAATGARLTVISGEGAQSLGAAEPWIDRVRWRPGVESTLTDFDLGIAPLLDQPYERGKSAYKILQYGACALPIVGSPVAANASVLAELGQLTAADTEEWVDALVDVLSAEANAREELGRRARDAVALGYSYDTWQAEWLAAVGMTGAEQPRDLSAAADS